MRELGVRKYMVTKQCYVPVGPGLKYKKPGQIVSLGEADAEDLADYVERLPEEKPSQGVQKLNTPPEPSGVLPVADLGDKPLPDVPVGEVGADAGEPGAAVQ